MRTEIIPSCLLRGPSWLNIIIMKIKGFYFITDSSLSKAGNESDVRNAVEAGVSVVQYRSKDSPTKNLLEEALLLKKICQGQALFIMNDRVDIAYAANADGVHLGQDDMPIKEARETLGKDKIIGVTVHDENEAARAIKMGADYLGVSPIFSTSTKLDAGPPAGISLIKKIKTIATVPLIAIGGINLSNAAEVIEAGADALCAISATVSADDVKLEILKFQDLFLP